MTGMPPWKAQFEQVWEQAAAESPPDYWAFYTAAGPIILSPDGPALVKHMVNEYRKLTDAVESGQIDQPGRNKWKLLAGLLSRLPPGSLGDDDLPLPPA